MLPSLSLHPALAAGNWEVTRSLSFILVCRDFCLSCSSLFSSSLVRDSLSHKRHSLELFLFFMLRALWVFSLSPPPPHTMNFLSLSLLFAHVFFLWGFRTPHHLTAFIVVSVTLTHMLSCLSSTKGQIRMYVSQNMMMYLMRLLHVYIDIRWSHRSVPVPEIAGSNPHRCLNSFHW